MTGTSNSPGPIRYHPLGQLVLARAREFLREPAAIFWVYVFPLIMVLALGVAFRNRPVDRISVDVIDGGGSRSVLSVLSSDSRFRAEVLDEQACRRRLRTGKTDLIVAVKSGAVPRYEYSFDPTRPGSVLARNAVDDRLQRAAGREDVAESSDREVTEPGGRYIDFLVPGLLGMGLMGGGLWGVGFAIVDMRIRKLLKCFLATPMKRSHFLAAVMISRLLFTVPEVLTVLVFSRLVFGVVNHGNYWVVTALIVLGAVEFSGIGLLVASRAQTLETVSGIMNLVMMPMWIGSGIFFSTDRFPQFVQPVIKALPLTPAIDALRAVMIEGVSLASLGLDLAIMSVWTVVTFALALRIFRWS